MRVLKITAALLLAAGLAACEEGEPVDTDPGNGGDTTEINLVVTTTQPITAGDPVQVRATVTENGSALGGVDVMFTATVNTMDRFIDPNPVSTSLLGTADTTISTLSSDRSLVIQAFQGTASSNVVTQTLEPRQ